MIVEILSGTIKSSNDLDVMFQTGLYPRCNVLELQNSTGLSNQIIFIGLRSSKDYYKRPRDGVGMWEGSLGCEFLREQMCAEGMGLWEEVG